MIAVISFISFLSLVVPVRSLQCLDPNGNGVDWYAVYKAPILSRKSAPFHTGLAHYYLDIKSPSWKLSKHLINDTRTAVYNTLQPIYNSKDKDWFYLMYNDEFPNNKTYGGGGHTKGVIAFNQESGFWLLHSVPKFPPFKAEGFNYPESGERFGQSFLCISLPYKMLGSIAKQLLYNEPHMYDYQAPASILKDFPILKDVLNGKRVPGPLFYNILPINSSGGHRFFSFAKSPQFGKDLYSDLVAPTLKDSLLAETWMDGRGKLASNCTFQYKVYNVNYITLPGDALFKRSKDHSKWVTGFAAPQNAVSSKSGYWTCIGDINRMSSQFKRGGGTVCLDNQGLWKAFRQSVTKYEKCNTDLANETLDHQV